MKLWKLAIAAAAVAALAEVAACKTVPAVTTTCLPLKPYTAADQQQLAAEVASLPPGSALARAMADYAAMRDADRACQR